MDALLEYGSDDTDDDDEKGDNAEVKWVQPQETLDFFNLDTRVESDEDQPKPKILKRELTTASGLTVEVPTDEFWKPVSSDDLTIATEKGKVSDYDKRDQRECNAIHSFGRGYFESFRNEKRREGVNFECNIMHNMRYNPSQNSHIVATASEHEQAKNTRHVSRGSLGQRQVNSGQEQIEDKSVNINTDNQINSRKLFYLHSKIKSHLNRKTSFRIPNTREQDIKSHTGPVNRIKWNTAIYSHLLMSVSMDGTIKVWNFWSSLDPCVQTVNVHTKAVKDACWAHSGKDIISGSYDKMAILSDVDTGKQLAIFRHENYVNCVRCHPDNTNVFVSGSYNILQAWDRRTPDRPVREFIYKDNTGQVQDVIFSADGNSMFSCCDLLSRDSADRNVMAWDFSSGVVLSNQIYQERYSCTRLKLHPTEDHFLAQTNGDYIAIFSTHKPYKLNKAKRFQGHKGNGYAVGFDVSVDGSLVVSGSADGNAYFYNYHTGRLLRTLTTSLDVCTDVAVHPVLASTVACCGWNGHVQVWR